MAGTIELTLADPGFLLGIRDITFVLDGIDKTTIGFGETKRIDCDPGEHALRIRLRGVFGVRRNSRALMVNVADGETKIIAAKYSRIWGNIRLEPA